MRTNNRRPSVRETLVPEAQKHFDTLSRLGLSEADAGVIASRDELRHLFDATFARLDDAQSAANWIIHGLAPLLKNREEPELPFEGAELAELITLVDAGTISNTAGKEVLARMLEGGGSPKSIVAEHGYQQLGSDAQLGPIVDQVIQENADAVSRYRAGKTALMGFFVGQVMKASRGKANPELAKQLLTDRLDAG